MGKAVADIVAKAEMLSSRLNGARSPFRRVIDSSISIVHAFIRVHAVDLVFD
jgi:hypothetical protein